MIMAKTSRVAPILLEALDAEDNELLLSRELDLSKGFHLPPIKEFGMEENIPRTEITAGSFIVENVDGGSTSGSESDPKGKRFLPWISSDGNDGTTQDNVTGDKGELLAYFKDLAFSVADIDFATIDHYLENGSDINATSQATGANIMHEIAAHWDKSVADYLLKRGLDIHHKDGEGRTPLHVAASTNHVEIVEWLADQGAELRARTNIEQQTPLHYAARYDSIQAIQILVDKGGDSEMVDYKGRTPMHLAAELDRTAAVECLILVPILADVRVQDTVGNHAIASMIRTMPQVALIALDHLHRVTPAKRKQYFLLNHLEPVTELSRTPGVKTPFEVAVEERRRNVLSHPVMQTLIAQKWKFMQWVFYMYLAVYMAFLLSWTILISFPSVQKKHEYVFPRDIWRIVIAFIGIATYALQIVEEVFEVIFSKNKYKDYQKLRSKMLQDDLNNVNCAFAEEKQFFESEITRLRKMRPNYFKDPWNFIDLVTYLLIFVLTILHVTDVFFHSPTFAMWVARVSCFVVILIWVRLFKHARGFRVFGPLVAIIAQSIGDIIRFFFLYAILFVPYVVCFWVLFGGPQSTSLSDDDGEDLTVFHRVAIMIFRMSLVDDYPYSSVRTIDEAMAAILVLTFLVFIAVVGLNLFIALLSDTFQRVYDNAQAIALLEQAKLILSFEEKMCSCFMNRYLKHIHENCSPLAEFYDDDEHYSKEPSTEVKKITHQIHSIVSELHANQQNGPAANVNELRGVSEDFTDYTDQQDDKLTRITQQLEELKMAFSAERAEVAQGHAMAHAYATAETAHTGYNPTSVPPGHFTRIHPSVTHGSKGRLAWETTQPTESAGATCLSRPLSTSPTKPALHDIFIQRQQHARLPPIAKRKPSLVVPLSLQARPSGASGTGYYSAGAAGPRNRVMYQRSESAPGSNVQPSHRRMKNIELQDVQWERKSQPRKSNTDTRT